MIELSWIITLVTTIQGWTYIYKGVENIHPLTPELQVCLDASWKR